MKTENDFIIERLYNGTGTAEGSNVPPRVIGDSRVPVVTGLQVALTTAILNGTQFTLMFDEPEYSDQFINGYDVYVIGIDNVQTPQGPYSTDGSPTIIRLVTQSANAVTFIVQTVLNNGMVSPLDLSPACTGFTISANSDRRLSAQFNDISNSGAVETTFHVTQLAANYLNSNGDSVILSATGTFTVSASTKQLRVYLGASVIFDSGVLAITAASTYKIVCEVFRVHPLGQRTITTLTISGATPTVQTTYTTSSETMANALFIGVTGQAGATGEITEVLFSVDTRPAP